MLSTALCLFCLLGFSGVFGSYNVAYHEGRSGDIIVQHDNTIIEDSILMVHGGQFNTLHLKEIEDVHYADLFAHVFGLQPFNTYADRAGFPQSDLFHKPKAALLFAMDSVGSVGLKYSSLDDYKRVDITSTSYPPNVYSIAANMGTGTGPTHHGIVGESWRIQGGGLVNAYSKPGQALRANIADIFSQGWQGRSLTLSASSSSLAGAFAVHPQWKQDYPSTNAYAYSLQGNKFVSLYDNGEDSLSFDPLKLLKSPSFINFAGVVSTVDGILQADISDHSSSFDLSIQEDFVLFAELGFVYNLINTLQSDSDISALAKDDIPDFLSFSFSSLKGIQDKYGERSEKYVVSILLADNAMRQAIEKISQIYDGRVVSSVVYLHTQVVAEDYVKNLLYENVRDFLHTDFEKHYPSIFLRSASSAVAEVCSILEAVFEHEKIHCLSPSSTITPKSTRLGDYLFDVPTNVTTLNSPVAGFWIVFWMAIIMFLFVLVGVYGLVAIGMEASKDSLLYRSAGRHLHQN